MTRLDFPAYLDHLRSDSSRFREVLATCDPAAPVPACPDWDAADLLWHLAEVQWFWAGIIRTRPEGPGEESPDRPDHYDALLATYDDFSAQLITELATADPESPAWSWAPEQTVGFTYRRQAHEALIHRLDAEQTAGIMTGPQTGIQTGLDPALAADGIAELLEVMYGGEAPSWGRFEPSDSVVKLELTDAGTDLWVRTGMLFGTEPESGKNCDGPHLLLTDVGEASATIRGTAAAVDAWLWKRRDDTGIEVTGNPAAYEEFYAAVSTPLT